MPPAESNHTPTHTYPNLSPFFLTKTGDDCDEEHDYCDYQEDKMWEIRLIQSVYFSKAKKMTIDENQLELFFLTFGYLE